MTSTLTKSTTGPLYIARSSFGLEQMLQHCLWKLVSETGLLHSHLSDEEVQVLSKLLKQRTGLSTPKSSDPDDEMSLLNSAIDKIVQRIRELELERQKSVSKTAKQQMLRNTAHKRMNHSNQDVSSCAGKSISIFHIGLTKRAARILQSMGIDTLEKLRTCSLPQLYSQERIGVKTIHDIETILGSFTNQASAD